MKRFTRFWHSEDERDFRPAVPTGVRLYAIGDIHGRDDLFADLLHRIERDRATRKRARHVLVFLGDFIDRGPASAQVIERLIGLCNGPTRTACIMGNHEEVLLRILDGDDAIVGDWLRFGGDRCMDSYGLDGAALATLGAHEAGAAIRAAIPAAHRIFLQGLADSFQAGDYLFVHAGIRPGVPLAEQSRRDLRWIRAPFLDHSDRHEYVVVHGHTISEAIVETPGRIGIDTGAYCSGVLTALAFEGDRRWAIQTVADK